MEGKRVKYKRNAVQCVHCGDVIESRSVHEMVWCSCESCAVDGGLMYLRRCFKNSPADFIELAECRTEADDEG